MPLEKKFKVCLVSISLAGGGLERSCAMLSYMLEEKGHEVHIVILNDEIDYPFTGKMFNLGKLKTPNDTPAKRIIRFNKFRNYLKHETFDVVIDHRPKNNFRRELFYSNFIYRNINKIYVVHGSRRQDYLTEKPIKFAKIYRENVLNIAVSEYIEEEILKKEGITNSITIHNAFDPSCDKNSETLPPILKGKTYLLSYGRLDDDIKDFSFLIESFSKSKLWEKDIYLVILGDGKDKEKLQKLAGSKDCASKVLFLPFTKNPFGIITHARCVTLTSKHEGFPMVLVESLGVGTPVVSLDIVSGPSEIVQHQQNGLLIAERSLPLFSEALQQICLNEALYQDLKRNAKPSVEKFSMQTISEKWNQALQYALH